MQIIQNLEKIGLTRNEAIVYLSTLEVGEGKVQKIAKKANLPRSSLYQILESLQKKSLVSSSKRQGILYYMAANSKQLLGQFKSKLGILENIIPELDAIAWQNQNRPRVRFFEGREGIIACFEEMLEEAKKTKQIYTIGLADVYKVFPKYFPEFAKRRRDNKVQQKSIVLDSDYAKEYKQKNDPTHDLRQIKILDNKYKFVTDETVVGDKIFAFSYSKDFYAVIIDSKDMAETKKQWFNFIWEHLD